VGADGVDQLLNALSTAHLAFAVLLKPGAIAVSFRHLSSGLNVRRRADDCRVCIPLRESDVLAPRSLRALASLEGDGLSFAKIIESGLGAGRIVKEVLVAVTRQDESEAFVAHESLDRAIHWCHVVSSISLPD
jgi:hypothetical protein